MRSLLKEFIVLFHSNDGFQRKLGSYQRAIKSEDWAFLRDVLLTIKGEMAVDMFSYKHTILDIKEKDVLQRTYYNIDQILDFLLKPEDWVRKQSKWERALSDLKGKVKPNQTGGK